jgi:membrane protease YdiL (CAAX protease family)
MQTLQVKDRRDGRLRSTVLVPVHYEGERYLVSMLGDGSEWVQNVRATGGKAFMKRGQTQPVTLIEVWPRARAPILKAWSQIATSGRKHLPAPYDAPVSAFEAIAADYPVFRIEGVGRVGPNPQVSGSAPAENSPHPLRFFGWVLLLSIPFHAWGIFWPIEALPFGLPVSATMIIVPALVATVMTWREQGRRATAEIWRRVGDVRRPKSAWWTLIAFLFMPAAMLFSYEIMRVLGLPLPAVVKVSFAETPVVFAAFFFGAIFEEVGWTGYATEPLQKRYGVFGAGYMIGAVWALWHIVPWWIVLGRPISWVAGQALATVAMRLVMGWIYAYGGRSLFLATVFHAMINTSFVLFPNNGSHYNPSVNAAVLMAMTTLLAVISGKLRLRFRNAAVMQ